MSALSAPGAIAHAAPLALQRGCPAVFDAAVLLPWYIRFPPVYAVAIAIVAGDALGNWRIFPPLWVSAALGAVAMLLFLAAYRGAGVAIALVAIISAATAPLHSMLAPAADPMSLRNFPEGAMLTVEGRLVREAERFPDKMRIYLDAERAWREPDHPIQVHGVVRITSLRPGGWRIGDEVRVSGRIRFPRNYGDPGEFDYESFMARSGISATMLAAGRSRSEPGIELLSHHYLFPASSIESVRARIAAFIDRNLDDPAASEMRALLIGDRGGIDRGMHEMFGRTGMAHMLVISGLHLSMVAGAMFALVRMLILLIPALGERGLANKLAALAAAAAVCAYAAVAGHHVSTTRALVMVLAYMLAVVIDRPREAIASLALAAIVICIAIPGSSADIGFELSFASVLSIVLGMRRFSGWIARRRIERGFAGISPSHGEIAWEWALGYVAVSFWAMLGVAPLTAYYFNQFSLVGLAANAVVVPIMGFGGTVLGLMAAALSFIWYAPAAVMLRTAGKFIAAGNLLTRWFADWPLGWERVFTPTALEIALAYAALFTWLLWPIGEAEVQSAQSKNEAEKPGVRFAVRHAIAAALALAIVLDAGWWARERYLNPSLRVTFLAAGEGDAAVVRFPGARVMLVDGASAWRDFDLGERLVARYLWSRKIMHVDRLVLSHPDQDHFGGFGFIARNFSPGEFWTVGAASRDEAYERLIATLVRCGIPIKVVDSTSRPIAENRATVAVMSEAARPGVSRNNSSMLMKVEFAGASILFTGDLEAEGEAAALRSGANLKATVLKVPHHGSRTSSTADFVAAVHPAIAVFSVGYHNRFHFPAPEVMERYHAAGAEILRTDLDGAICVTADASGFSAAPCEKRSRINR